MPKTIAITPSWYWPEAVDRVAGIPPFGVTELCVNRHARERPDSLALIYEEHRLTYGELNRKVSGLAETLRQKGIRRAAMNGSTTADSVIKLFAALSAGIHIRISGADEDFERIASDFGSELDLRQQNPDDSESVNPENQPVFNSDGLREAAIAIPANNAVVNHSNRSLLAAAISMVTFLQPARGRSWLASLPLYRWEGLLSVLCPLYSGVPLVISAQDNTDAFTQALQEHRPGYALTDLAWASLASRESKREVKKAREILEAMLLATDGIFDAGDRQRVGKSFRCPALTLFGLAETSTIFASHPMWYLDESVGIPITNAHVIPSDPRTGTPIQALWELVESAEVTLQGPSLMCGYEGGGNENPVIEGRFRTGVIASSDANGMIYVLPD